MSANNKLRTREMIELLAAAAAAAALGLPG